MNNEKANIMNEQETKTGQEACPLDAIVTHTKLDCGHLFNGIGGFALAAEWMGWDNIWHSEINEFANKIMDKNFPESKQYGDIKKTDWAKAETVDLISGGFPCQPFSSAGKRKGTEDDRYLWPAMLDVIKSIRPRWVVAENVYGIINWNEGLVIEQVLSDLENEGYESWTYILPAASVGAPHKRDRVWIVAYSESIPRKNGARNDRRNPQAVSKERLNEFKPIANAGRYECRDWQGFPAEPPVCGGDDGISERVDRIEALGNAIVPQVAYNIFRTIHDVEVLCG